MSLLVLTATTDKIQLTTTSTANVDVVAGFIDRDQTTGDVGAANRQLTTINTATTTDIVAAPAATTTRNIRYLSVRNRHATASNDVTVVFDANGTDYELVKMTLLAGETLLWTPTTGFSKFSDASRLERLLIKGSDQTFATAASFADITDLTMAVRSGLQYSFECHLYHNNDASTTGSQFAVNFANVPTSLRLACIDTVTPSTTASAHSAGSATARDTSPSAQTTGSTTVRLGIYSGHFVPSADDTFAMRATSEVTVAGGLVVRTGSWLRVWRPT
jgi:hypothetical protein